MPYVAPSTVAAGQTYTATAHNIIVEDVIDHESRINSIEHPFRNILINGAMQFAQRASSVTGITTIGYYTADRWQFYPSSAGTYTQAISADAPTGSGFRNSLRTTLATSAITGASTLAFISQKLEGQTLQRIRKGTSSAQQLTFSFWAKSGTTGTFIAELYDNDNTRSVSASYSISAANTWEFKTITFPADTTGAFDNDNGASLEVIFWLAAGSTYSGGTLQTSWGSVVSANRAVGQTNIAAAVNRYLAITGVQLETGSYATDYAFIPYETELQQCQRYFESSFAPGITPGTNSLAVVEAGGFVLNSPNSGGAFVPYAVQKRTHTHTVSVWAALTNPSSGRARRAYDGTVHNASVGASTVVGFNLTITSGTADLYQIGWTASNEL